MPLTGRQQVVPQICDPDFCVKLHDPPTAGQVPGPVKQAVGVGGVAQSAATQQLALGMQALPQGR